MTNGKKRGKAIEIKTNRVGLTVVKETIRKAASIGNDLIAMVSLTGFTKPAQNYMKEKEISFARIKESEIRNMNNEAKEKEK